MSILETDDLKPTVQTQARASSERERPDTSFVASSWSKFCDEPVDIILILTFSLGPKMCRIVRMNKEKGGIVGLAEPPWSIKMKEVWHGGRSCLKKSEIGEIVRALVWFGENDMFE